jgi:hypothetical protein
MRIPVVKIRSTYLGLDLGTFHNDQSQKIVSKFNEATCTI